MPVLVLVQLKFLEDTWRYICFVNTFILVIGKYLLVIGELQKPDDRLSKVLASKIQDLSDQPILDDMWQFEVEDFLNYMLNKSN